MSLTNGIWNKMNKNEEFHEKFISIRKHITKRLHKNIVSLWNTYIHTYINPQTHSGDHAITWSYMLHQPRMGRNCTYNQYALLNLSTNMRKLPNSKENIKNICTTMCVHIHDSHTYIHIHIFNIYTN